MILRIVTCDICGDDNQEIRPGEGFPGWGQLQGIALNGIDNPSFCPIHLAEVSNFICKLQEENNGRLDS